MMGVNHDFLSGNFVYTPLDDCPTIYRKHQDYSLSKFKKDLKNEKILNNYKDALEELQELREYKRVTTLRNKKYEESIHAYKNQIRNLKKHMYCGSEVNIKLINVFISLISDIIDHLCLDPYRSILSSLPYIHTILCSSPIRDKKIYNCSKLVHATLTKNVNQSHNKSNNIGKDVESVRNIGMHVKEDMNLHKVVSDLEWLGSETNDKAWLTLQDRWEICKIDLKWLCVSTNNRTWILYRHIWDQCPDDLKFITVLTNEKKWLNLYKLWRTIPLSTKLKAIVSNNPDLCVLTCSDILINDDPIYKVDVLSLHQDISSLVQQNSLKYKLVTLSNNKEGTRDTRCRHIENLSDEDGDSDYMKSFVKIREVEKEMNMKSFTENTKDSGTAYRKETEEPKDHSIKVPPTNIPSKEMNLKDSLSKNMNLMNKNVKEVKKINDFSKKMVSSTIKKEEPSKVPLKIPTLMKKEPMKSSPISAATVLNEPVLPKKDIMGKKEIPKITVPKSFGLKKQVELKKSSLPFGKKEISIPKTEIVKESKKEASTKSENMAKGNEMLTKEDDNTTVKENKMPTMKTKIPTIKGKIPTMKDKMPPMKNKMPVKENEAATKNQVKSSNEGNEGNEEDEEDEEEGVLIERDKDKLGVGQRILDTITKIILPQGNTEETKDNKEVLQKEPSSKETNNPTPNNINNTTVEGKSKMDPTSMNKLLLKKKEGIKKPGSSPVPPSLSKPMMKPPFTKAPTEVDQFKMNTPTKSIPKVPNNENTVADKISNFTNAQSLNEARENRKEENVYNKNESEERMTKREELLRKTSSKESTKYSNLTIEIQKNKLSEEKSKLSQSLLENEKDSNKHLNILSSITDIENKTSDEAIQRHVSIQEKRMKSGLSHKYIDLKKELSEGISSNSVSPVKIPLKTKPVFDKNSHKLISPMKKPPPILKKVLESDLSDLDTTNKRATADVIAKRTNISLYIDVKRKNSLSSLKAQKKMFLPPKFPKSNL